MSEEQGRLVTVGMNDQGQEMTHTANIRIHIHKKENTLTHTHACKRAHTETLTHRCKVVREANQLDEVSTFPQCTLHEL